jgi:anti-sigma factor RsiW
MPDFWSRLFNRGRRTGEPAGLACQELVELVSDYFEGALSEADRARFEAHIAGCNDCTTYVWQMRETLALMGELTTESMSPEAQADLLAAFRDWKSGA